MVESFGSNATIPIAPANTEFQTCPASVERKIPVFVAARSGCPSLEMARELTYENPPADGSGFHVTPPSVVLKMPPPRIAPMPAMKPSPVPAQRVSESVGSITREQTAKLAMKSSVGTHEAPVSADLHTPPPTPAAKIRLGFVGSITNARVRPPTFPGPRDVQPVLLAFRPAAGPSTRASTANTEVPTGTPATSREMLREASLNWPS